MRSLKRGLYAYIDPAESLSGNEVLIKALYVIVSVQSSKMMTILCLASSASIDGKRYCERGLYLIK